MNKEIHNGFIQKNYDLYINQDYNSNTILFSTFDLVIAKSPYGDRQSGIQDRHDPFCRALVRHQQRVMGMPQDGDDRLRF